MQDIKRLNTIISKFPRAKILVVGDLILDEFIWGSVNRISPEAPVPVVWVKSESFMPGGAANVANNINALDAGVYLAGVVGNDERGGILKGELQKKGINIDGVITDDTRPTTLKTRVIAHHQHVVRIDREATQGIRDNIMDKMLGYIRKRIKDVDAVVIEDYGKGLIAPRLLKETVALARCAKKAISVDPKQEHFSYYKNVTVITPNRAEASDASNIEIKDEATLGKAGKALLARLKCDAVLITLGEDGMRLFERRGKITHIPTVAQEVFDVSGAGDTVIAAFTTALACGAGLADAAYISNFAAGIVVGKVGVAVATRDELLGRIRDYGWKR